MHCQWRTLSCYQQNADFVFPSPSEGTKPLISRRYQPQDQASIRQVWHPRVGCTFGTCRKHAGGMGNTNSPSKLSAPQSNLSAPTNICRPRRRPTVGAGQTSRRNLATGLLSQSKPHSFNNPRVRRERSKASRFRHSLTSIWSWGAQLDPDWDPDFWTGFLSG